MRAYATSILYLIFLLPAILTFSGCSSKEASLPKPPPAASSSNMAEPSLTISSKTHLVPILLPLSGANASLGQAMFDAASLALTSLEAHHISLVPIDTESITSAEIALKKLLPQKPSLILGPVFSRSTAQLSEVIQQEKIAMISFSNDSSLKNKGIYLLGFMPEQQLQEVALYALNQGITDYAVLAPHNSYGQLAVSSLQEAVVPKNGNIALVEYYDANAPTLTPHLQTVLQQLTLRHATSPEHRVALVLVEGGERLKEAALVLKDSKTLLPNLQLLGTGQWDTPLTANQPSLQGGWFASTDPAPRSAFISQFRTMFGYEPPRLATLAYDGVALAVNLLPKQPGEIVETNQLLQPKGFTGIEGIFRFTPQGINERGLNILEVGEGTFTVKKAAPTFFAP